jgi:hypothetical protein
MVRVGLFTIGLLCGFSTLAATPVASPQTVCKLKDQKKCPPPKRPIVINKIAPAWSKENPGDTLFSFGTTLYTNQITTNNGFGTVKSNLNKSYDFDISQRWSDWFRIHLLFGAHTLSYSLYFGDYSQSFLHYGLDMDFNVSKRLSFNLGLISGSDLIFREVLNTPVGYIAHQEKTHLNANYNIIKSSRLNITATLGAIAIPPVAPYGFDHGYGVHYELSAGYYLTREILLKGGAFQEDMTYSIDGANQKGIENAIFLNLTFHSREEKNQ